MKALQVTGTIRITLKNGSATVWVDDHEGVGTEQQTAALPHGTECFNSPSEQSEETLKLVQEVLRTSEPLLRDHWLACNELAKEDGEAAEGSRAMNRRHREALEQLRYAVQRGASETCAACGDNTDRCHRLGCQDTPCDEERETLEGAHAKHEGPTNTDRLRIESATRKLWSALGVKEDLSLEEVCDHLEILLSENEETIATLRSDLEEARLLRHEVEVTEDSECGPDRISWNGKEWVQAPHQD